jgi:hypothetical protein
VEKEALLLGIGNYSSKASRLEAICDHYLDLGRGLIPNPVEECLDVMPTGATSGSW